MKVEISPSKLSGYVTAPISKSHFIRVLVSAFALEKKVNILCQTENLSQDILHSLSALKSLGVKIEKTPFGFNVSGFSFKKKATVDVGESATLLRLLIPVCLKKGIEVTFCGGKSLNNRNISRSFKGLKGVFFSCETLPFTVKGNFSEEETLILDTTSQALSGLIIANAIFSEKVKYSGKIPSLNYVKMTIKTLKDFGVSVKKQGNLFNIKKQTNVDNLSVKIEGDYSSCALFYALNNFNNDIKIRGLNSSSCQADKIAKTIFSDIQNFDTVLDGENIPDLVPIISAYACIKDVNLTITNVSRLKYKESDRLNGLVSILKSLGANIFSDENNIYVKKGSNFKSKEISSNADHRIVMALTLIGLTTKTITIIDGENVEKSYPNFFDELKRLNGKINVL